MNPARHNVPDNPQKGRLANSKANPRGIQKTTMIEHSTKPSRYPQDLSKTYLWRALACGCRKTGGGTNRCGRGCIRSRQSMMLLSIGMGPIRTGIHMLRRRGVSLVLCHLVPLRLIGRVGGRIGGAVGRERGIYRNGRVRLYVRTARARRRGVDERTCCLSHTCRTAGLRIGSVGLGRTVKVVLVGRRTGGRRRVQTVVRLRGVGRGNIGGSNLRLRSVLWCRANLGLRGVVSTGSSRSLVCRFLFRRCVGNGGWVVRTWLCVLGSRPVVHKRKDSRARMPTNLWRKVSA